MPDVRTTKLVKPRGRGRPKNIDATTPFMTTLPESIVHLVEQLAEAQRRTKSEVVSDAIRGYARRFADVIKNM